MDSSKSVLSITSNSPSTLTPDCVGLVAMAPLCRTTSLRDCPVVGQPAAGHLSLRGLQPHRARTMVPALSCGQNTQMPWERTSAGLPALSLPSAFFCAERLAFPAGKRLLLKSRDQCPPSPKTRHSTQTPLVSLLATQCCASGNKMGGS